MIADRIARHQYRRGLTALEEGDLSALLAQFSPSCTLSFAGDTPLGADGLSGREVRAWFERFLRLLPEPRFEIQRIAVVGPPWSQQLFSHVLIRSTVDGAPYVNQFAHYLRIRWGRVVEDRVLEDTQRWERACRTLVGAGVDEAGAGPIGTPLR